MSATICESCVYLATADTQLKKIDALKAENKRLRQALEFYASRTVYERLNQFPGDSEYVPCSEIADDALKLDIDLDKMA